VSRRAIEKGCVLKGRREETEEEIRELEAQLKDREAALSAHSVRPHQIQMIEDLEEKIAAKKKELAGLRIEVRD
jgi:hypothetical protein